MHLIMYNLHRKIWLIVMTLEINKIKKFILKLFQHSYQKENNKRI